MATTSITKTFTIDNVLTNVTSVVLSDPDGNFGVKRNDNDATVVADGTAMTNISTGVYRHTFTDPDLDLAYTAWIEWVFDGDTFRDESQINGTTTAQSAAATPASSTVLATLTGSDITQEQLAGMIAEIDQFILTLVADRGAELVYAVDDRKVDRAKGLEVAMELRKHYKTLLAEFPAEEQILYATHGHAHHVDFVHRLTQP